MVEIPNIKAINPNQGVIDELKKLNEHAAHIRARMDMTVELLRSLNANINMNARGSSYRS